MVEGAPGFEHTFLKRALAADRGLDVDSVVRKGLNDDGQPTFFVQAAESRAAALSSGYPTTPEALFQYDAIVFGNVEAEFFTRDQLALTARFVAERGGGLLVLGTRSFERQGLTGTPLAEALPVDLTDRRAATASVPAGGGAYRSISGSLLPGDTDSGFAPYGWLTVTSASQFRSFVARSRDGWLVSSSGRSSMNDVLRSPAMKDGSSSTAWRNGMFVDTPRMRNSARARLARVTACG